ncbi:unnamed protein product [Pleuronectes platessa]|uniref:Cadherin domain-containing protein n=1 Tax=Pleuronectes platessa TaxID=8262 RepID=A0A9N7Z5B6_PLEPL|nr:unnamed protein product [Pleuronectes platessa]
MHAATRHHPKAPAGPDWYLNKVKLKIIDVNDNVPEWNMKPYPYLAVVSPEASAGTLVYQLQAQDGDEGSSGEVEYFLSDGGDGCFAVDKNTGQVVTTGLLLQRDREYLLSVVALDGPGSRSAPAMLSVMAGARAPQFTNISYAISIPENTPEGQPFLVVLAISFQKQPIGYSLLINPSSLFSIRQETGEISLTRALDYESDQRRYLLMVRASEEPGGLSTATEPLSSAPPQSEQAKPFPLLNCTMWTLRWRLGKTYPGYFRTITQLSLHTLHTAVTGSL